MYGYYVAIYIQGNVMILYIGIRSYAANKTNLFIFGKLNILLYKFSINTATTCCSAVKLQLY